MINLLPPERKREIRAGQTNVLLLRYCVLSLVLAALLFILAGSVYFLMQNSQKAAQTAIQESETKNAQYQKVQQDVAAFNTNLQTARTILDKEVRYSQIAVKIAQTLPSGVILQSLQLDAKTFGQPMTLNAQAKTYDDAIRLKTAFEQSSSFSNVYLLSVTNGSDTGEGSQSSAYPVSIVINVTINPEIAKS